MNRRSLSLQRANFSKDPASAPVVRYWITSIKLHLGEPATFLGHGDKCPIFTVAAFLSDVQHVLYIFSNYQKGSLGKMNVIAFEYFCNFEKFQGHTIPRLQASCEHFNYLDTFWLNKTCQKQTFGIRTNQISMANATETQNHNAVTAAGTSAFHFCHPTMQSAEPTLPEIQKSWYTILCFMDSKIHEGVIPSEGPPLMHAPQTPFSWLGWVVGLESLPHTCWWESEWHAYG